MADETRHLQTRFSAVGVQSVMTAARQMARSFDNIAASQTRMAAQSVAAGNAFTRGMRFSTFGPMQRNVAQVEALSHAFRAIPRNIQGIQGAAGAAVGGLSSVIGGGINLMARGVVRGFQWMATSALSTLQGLVARAKTMALLGFGAVGAIAVSSLMAFGQQERQKLRLNALMGSPARGAQAFEWVRDFVATSTLNTQETIDAVSSMLTMKMSPEDQLRPLMNAMSKIGGTAQELQQIIGYLGNVNQGVFMTRSLNDLQRQGIPVYDLMAEKLGVAREAWLSMTDAQKRSLNIYPGLIAAIREWAGNAGESMVNTVIGKYRKLQERIERTKIRIGAVLAPSALQMMDNLANWIERPQTIKAIERWAQNLVTFAQRAFRAVGMLWGRLTLWFSNPANVQRVTGWVSSMIAGVQQVGRITGRVLSGLFEGGGGLPPWVAQVLQAFTLMLMLAVQIKATLIGLQIGSTFGPWGAAIGAAIGGTVGLAGASMIAGQFHEFMRNNPVGQGSTFADLRERARWNSEEFEADRAAAQRGIAGEFSAFRAAAGTGPGGVPQFPSVDGGSAAQVGETIGNTIAQIIGGRQLARAGLSRTELQGVGTGRSYVPPRIVIDTSDGSPISQAQRQVAEQAVMEYDRWLFNTPEGRQRLQAQGI